jgi:hypothetical protein
MSDLRQILSQGRKRIGLLVGAGAPLSIRINSDGRICKDGDPLIPAVDELTKLVIEELPSPTGEVVRKIQSEIGSGANIEAILSRVRLLQNALGEANVHGLNGRGYAALGEQVCSVIGRKVGASLPSDQCAYHELVGWISGTHRACPVEIFTTNYDMLFEEAFERARVPYFDGFTGGSSPFFDPVTVAGDDLPPRWSRLWKLHGSLGWSVENGNVVRTGGKSSTQLVYPDHLKYDLTQKQPYSSLFERLKRFLLTPDTILLATGFSFRDAHICAVIDEALAVNSNASVFTFQWQTIKQEECACRLAQNRPNMSVYAADGAVIGGVQGPWQLGDIPNNWHEIRKTFWGQRIAGGPSVFLLGDFVALARFCALAQASDMTAHTQDPPTSSLGTASLGQVA